MRGSPGRDAVRKALIPFTSLPTLSSEATLSSVIAIPFARFR